MNTNITIKIKGKEMEITTPNAKEKQTDDNSIQSE